MLVMPNPYQVFLYGYEEKKEIVKKQLTYIDKKVDFAIGSFKRGRGWFVAKYGEENFAVRLSELQAERKKCLLFEDESGLWTYSGLASRLCKSFDDTVTREFSYPAIKGDFFPWSHMPEYSPRPYQQESHDKLLEVKHGAIELCTGSGKSRIIEMLAKSLALQTMVVAPSVSIATQLYDNFVYAFGTKNVGQYFDGKKQINKLFTVAVAASLTKVDEDHPAYKHFSKTQVLLCDESHLFAADTLASICFGVCKNASYRFFVSATQLRNDGADLLLEGITGRIVHSLTVQEAVNGGYLAKPMFKFIRLNSSINYVSDDVHRMSRKHLLYNPQVNTIAADIINKLAISGKSVLVLIKEMEQFSTLLPLLRVEARFAHGGVSADNKDKVPEAYHKSNTKQLVADFNAGKFPVLVGTSAVSTGTDFQGVNAIVRIKGGSSEIEVRQDIGRGTRKVPGKESFVVIDFDVKNIEVLTRHAKARKEYYRDIYPGLTEMEIK